MVIRSASAAGYVPQATIGSSLLHAGHSALEMDSIAEAGFIPLCSPHRSGCKAGDLLAPAGGCWRTIPVQIKCKVWLHCQRYVEHIEYPAKGCDYIKSASGRARHPPSPWCCFRKVHGCEVVGYYFIALTSPPRNAIELHKQSAAVQVHNPVATLSEAPRSAPVLWHPQEGCRCFHDRRNCSWKV